MIKINNIISIFDDKLKFKAIKSTGPEAKHVNKASTGIILQYNILNHNYPGWFIDNLKNKINSKNYQKMESLLLATNYRSQSRNKKDAIERLLILFKECSNRKKIRKKTKPPAYSNEKRINEKKK